MDFAQDLIQQSLDLKVFPKHRDEDCLCGLILPFHALEEILQHSPLCPPPWELEENLAQSTENCITVLALIIQFDSIKGNLQ